MKTKISYVAIALVLGCMAVVAYADQTCQITLSNVSKIGNAEFQPGNYRLVVDDPKVVLTELKSGKSVELEAKVENTDEKFRQTEIHTSNADGVSKIIEIRIGGSKTKLAFN